MYEVKYCWNCRAETLVAQKRAVHLIALMGANKSQEQPEVDAEKFSMPTVQVRLHLNAFSTSALPSSSALIYHV